MPIPDFPQDYPNVTVPPASHGLAVLDWIVGVAFLGAASCLILSIIGVAIFGASLGFLRKLAAALLGCGVASLIVKVVVVKYLWLMVLIALVGGVLAAVLYAWGHRWALEKFFGVELTGDGVIGPPPGPPLDQAVSSPPTSHPG